ncbi:MAG: N-acetylglucosamine kinase, partial [Rhodobacteraceae bacterium]|nr:N-acetylglucosamine kinase [Paracoccaceae bacterium]
MGGTATRWACCDGTGALLARGTTAGATGLVFDAAGRAGFLAALAPLRAAGPFDAAYLGVTGAGFADDPALRALAAEALRLVPAALRLVNDMVLAWQATWPDGGGHLVAAGTGSVGFSMRAGTTLVGGRGTLIDDGGSGAWIALRALDTVWRLIDEHGTPRGAETLAATLFAAMGGSDWEATRRAVYGGDRGAIGRLARPVAEAAHAGDPVAEALMARAGAELARLARALVARAGPAPVAVIGGVVALHPMIRAALEAETPGLTLTY